MNTITEHISQYLETERGQRDREYNDILRTYLALLENGTIENNDAESVLWRRIQEYITQIEVAPNSVRSGELLGELLQDLDIYVNEHFITLRSFSEEENAIVQFQGLRDFLVRERELSPSQEYSERIDALITRIEDLLRFLETEQSEEVAPPLEAFFARMQEIYTEAISRDRTEVANQLLIDQLEEFRELRERYLREKEDLLERYAAQRCTVQWDILCSINELTGDDAFTIPVIGMYPSSLWESDPRLVQRRDEIFELQDLSHDEILERYANFELPTMSLDNPLPVGSHLGTIDRFFESPVFVQQLQTREGYQGLNVHQMKQRFINDLMLNTEESIRSVFATIRSQLWNGGVEINFGAGNRSVVFENTEQRDRAITGYMLLLDGILLDPDSKFDALSSWVTSVVSWGVDLYTIAGALLDVDNELLDGFLFLLTTGSLVYFNRNVPFTVPLTDRTTLRAGFVTWENERERDVRDRFWRWINELDNFEIGSEEYNRRVWELSRMVSGDFNLSERLEIFRYYIRHAGSVSEANAIQQLRRRYLLLRNENHFYTTMYRNLWNGRITRTVLPIINKTLLSIFNARTYQQWGQINYLWLRRHLDSWYVESFRDYFLETVRLDSATTLSESPLISETNRRGFMWRIQEIVDDPRQTLDRNIFVKMWVHLNSIQTATGPGLLSWFRDEFEWHINSLFERYISGEISLSWDGRSNLWLDNLLQEAVTEKENLLNIYSDRGRLHERIRNLETTHPGLAERIRAIAIHGIRDIDDGGDLLKSLETAVKNFTSPRTTRREIDFIRDIEAIETRIATSRATGDTELETRSLPDDGELEARPTVEEVTPEETRSRWRWWAELLGRGVGSIFGEGSSSEPREEIRPPVEGTLEGRETIPAIDALEAEPIEVRNQNLDYLRRLEMELRMEGVRGFNISHYMTRALRVENHEAFITEISPRIQERFGTITVREWHDVVRDARFDLERFTRNYTITPDINRELVRIQWIIGDIEIETRIRFRDMIVRAIRTGW